MRQVAARALALGAREIDDGSIYMQAPGRGTRHLIKPSKWTREISLLRRKSRRFSTRRPLPVNGVIKRSRSIDSINSLMRALPRQERISSRLANSPRSFD